MVVRKAIQDAGKEWNQITMESNTDAALSTEERKYSDLNERSEG